MATPKKTPETDLDALAASATTAVDAKAAEHTYTNASSNPRQVGARVVPVGKSITLTQLEQDDKKVQAQVARMLKLKILTHVTS